MRELVQLIVVMPLNGKIDTLGREIIMVQIVKVEVEICSNHLIVNKILIIEQEIGFIVVQIAHMADAVGGEEESGVGLEIVDLVR